MENKGWIPEDVEETCGGKENKFSIGHIIFMSSRYSFDVRVWRSGKLWEVIQTQKSHNSDTHQVILGKCVRSEKGQRQKLQRTFIFKELKREGKPERANKRDKYHIIYLSLSYTTVRSMGQEFCFIYLCISRT